MKIADVVIIGTGSLARGVTENLAHSGACGAGVGSLRIAIVGRSAAKVSQLALIANARAASCGSSTTFVAAGMANFTALAFSRLVRSFRPKVIFFAASIQSPWESANGPNAWTKLMAQGGFGITLPLQLKLAAEMSQGAAGSDAAIVNACYPDCVNVVLDRLGLRTTCGIGNSAIVEAFCRSRDGIGDGDIRVVAHHGHLGGWLKGKTSPSEPRIWLNGRGIKSARFSPHFGAASEVLNAVTSTTANRVVMALLSGEKLLTSIPGVAGLPGGYPFAVERGRFILHLPAGISSDEAVAHNKTGERLDGLELDSGAKFVGEARRSLRGVKFEYSEGFDFADWRKVCNKMIALRDSLRLRTG